MSGPRLSIRCPARPDRSRTGAAVRAPWQRGRSKRRALVFAKGSGAALDLRCPSTLVAIRCQDRSAIERQGTLAGSLVGMLGDPVLALQMIAALAAPRALLQSGCANSLELFGRGRNEDCSSPPAQIPACAANAPGSCLGSNVIGLRGIGYPCSSDPWARRFSDMPVPALCPGHASQLTLPSTGRLPSTVSAADVTRHCSRLHGTMQPSNSSSACMPIVRLLPSWAGPTCRRTQMRSPRFQRKDVSTCMGSSTARGSSSASHFRGRMLLSGQLHGVSTSKFDPFRSSIPSPWSPL